MIWGAIVKRFVSLIFVAIILTLFYSGQAIAQSRTSVPPPASQKSKLISIRPGSAVGNGITSRARSSSTATNQLSFTSVYARNASGVTQTVFSPGAGTQYTFYVDNTGSAVSAEVQIEVFWYNVDDLGTQILDTEYHNVNFPSGLIGYYNPETVPKNAVPGPYTILVTLSYDSSAGIAIAQGNSQTGDPAVSGNDSLAECNTVSLGSNGALPPACGCPSKPKATCIPYWDQYAVSQTNSEDCGIASVAMTLNYYGLGPLWADTWSGGRTAGLKAIRNASGKTGDVTTLPADLEKAITYLHGSYKTVVPNYAASAPATIVGIAAAIRAGKPVIAFVDASALGREYTGHWLVVTGFTANSSGTTSVVAYDPDENPVGGAYKGGAITVPLSTFNNAIVSGTNPSFGGANIVVTG
jgi:Peptidase_C39 like family